MADWNAVRKGWVYQRKRGILFVTNWSPKYLVLYSQPIPALALYEQRSDATPPYAPIMHIDLQGLQIGGVENGLEKSTKWIEKMKLALLDISGKGSKAGSRKVSTIQEINQNAHRETRSGSLSPPEPGMDCEGRLLLLFRPATSQLPALKLCFALNSIEDRNAWVVAIKQVLQEIDDQKFTALNARLAASLLSQSSSSVIENTSESPSTDDHCRLSFAGETVLDSNSLERIIKISCSNREPWQRSSNDSIKINQITSSNDVLPQSKSKDYTVQQVNEAFHRAIASRRDAKNSKERFFYEIEALKALYKFHTIVAEKAIPILDKLHLQCSQEPFNNSHEDSLVLYEEKSTGLCIQFIADYMMSNNDAGQDKDVLVEAASKWLHQEMLAIRWINQQTGGALHGSLIAIIDYKGFRVMGHVQMLPNSFPAWDLEAGIYDKELHTELQATSLLLNTQNNFSWNLPNGHIIQNFLHPHIKARKIGNRYHLHNLHDLIPQWPESSGSFRPEFLQSFSQTIAQGVLPIERSNQLLRILVSQRIDELLEKLTSLDLIPLDSRQWNRLFHSFGINCSLLGVFAQRATLPHISDALIIEMIARTVKHSLSVQLRETVLHFRQVHALRVEEELAMIVLNTFNTLLFVGSSGGARFSELFQAISSRYSYPQEINTLMRGFHSPVALAWALQYHCGVILSEEAMEKISEQMGPLDEDDFLSFDVKIGPVAFDASPLEVSENFDEVSRLAYSVTRLLSTTSELSLKSPLLRAELALSLSCISSENQNFEDFQLFYDMALRIAPNHHAVKALMTIERIKSGAKAQSVRKISQAEITSLNFVRTCFGSHHPLELTIRKRSLELYGRLKSQEATEHALDSCKAGLVTAQKVLGLGHPYTRDFLIQIGDSYGNLGFYDDAIRYMEDALKSASCPREQAVIYLKICNFRRFTNDYESAIMSARNALRIIDESKKLEDRKFVHSILETISELAESIYDQEFTANEIKCNATFEILNCLKLVPQSMAEYLREALECYERLFHEKRLANENDAVNGITQPSNADAKDEIVLAKLVKKIFLLRIRLAKPAQKTIIGALERNLATLDSREQQRLGEMARDLLVRLLSGAISPEDYIARTLEASESISEDSQAGQVALTLIRLL